MFPETYVPGYHYVESVKKMEYRKLGETDFTVSKLSLGVSALGSVFRPTDDTESWAVVDYAIKSGINFIDASPFYGDGKAEKVLGEAIRRKRIPRKAFYMATKGLKYWHRSPIYMFVKQNYKDGTLSETDEVLLNYYSALLKSNKSYKNLSLKYKGVGDRSIKDTAALVGLRLPILYQDPKKP